MVAVISLRRSGISDLLGLLALLTMGLEGGRLRLPITLQLALRGGMRPSLSSLSPVLVGLLLGCMTGMEGPPAEGHATQDPKRQSRSEQAHTGFDVRPARRSQKSLCLRCRWYVEALRGVLLCEDEDEEDEPVAEECLLVPLVMGLGRTLARDRLLAERDSVPSFETTHSDKPGVRPFAHRRQTLAKRIVMVEIQKGDVEKDGTVRDCAPCRPGLAGSPRS